MTLRRTTHPRADAELLDAARYYESAEPGLGHAFLDEVARTVADIVAHPHAGALISRSARRRLLRRFPYAVIYSLPAESVRILAIAHVKRRPYYWRVRA